MIPEPISNGIALIVLKTVWDGGGKALGMFGRTANEPTQELVFQASQRYVENYTKRHGILKVLGMREPVALESVYAAVQFLYDQAFQRFESVEALEEAYRIAASRSFQGRDSFNQEGLKVANEKQYLMVLGGPGAGKSTFLRRMGLEALKGTKGAYRSSCIPVFVDLKVFNKGEINVEKAIAEEFRICGFPSPEESTQKLLQQGKLLVLLDGLDEVAVERMNEAISQIQSFVDAYKQNRYIASCRTAAYRHNFRLFSDVAITDFDDRQIKQFIDNWFRSEPDIAQDCWEKLNSDEHTAAKELTQTPLLLTLVCLLYERSRKFPTNRSTLYERALRVLLEEWAAEKGIPQDDLYKGLDTGRKEMMLAEIAHDSFQQNRLFSTRREIANQIEQLLKEILPEEKGVDGLKVLRSIEVQHGILVERAEGIYSFSHLTLQEYLTAQHIDDKRQIEKLVTEHLTNPRWKEVFILVAGLMRGGADELLLQIEKQAREYVKFPKLKALLRWTDQVANTSEANFPPAVKRALNVFLVLESDFAPALEFIRIMGFTSKELNSNTVLKDKVVKETESFATHTGSTPIRSSFDLSAEEVRELSNYFYINTLMVSCRQAAVRISPIAWAGIEMRMLLIEADDQSRALATTQQFFDKSEVTTEAVNDRILKIITVPRSLRLSPALFTLVTVDKLTNRDIDELVEHSKKPREFSSEQTGIIVYQTPPDTSVRVRIAKARLVDNLILVPIPLAELEKAVLDSSNTCISVFVEYINKYVQHTDFFNDKNAISDTLTFFGRMELLQRLKEELSRFQGVGLFGLRKSGKTSVLYQLGFLLRKHPVVTIDLQAYSGSYYGSDLFNEIIKQLTKLAGDRDSQLVPLFENFVPGVPASNLTVEFIQRVSSLAESLQGLEYQLPIFCFLDEVERVLPTSEDTREKVEEFNACFGALRVLSQEQRKLSLLVADVYPNCNRINHWEQKEVPTNPVFSFFKEVFLSPFSERETAEMLTDIGKLMSVDFDQKTLQAIYRESGGHPFIARQIAHFLNEALCQHGNTFIEWSAAQEELENSSLYFDELINYFDESIWKDLENRNFQAATNILEALANGSNLDEWVAELDLLEYLNTSFSKEQYRKALNWLVAVGLVSRERSSGKNKYQIRMLGFLRWLKL